MFWAPSRTSSRQPPDFASGLSGGAFTWRGRVLRFYLARHPAVFVGPAPWSSCRSGEAPAAGTKSSPAAAQGYRCARWRGQGRLRRPSMFTVGEHRLTIGDLRFPICLILKPVFE